MHSPHTAQLQPALVLGLSPTGLIAIRSLGRRGIPVFGADLNPWGIARFSKYCRYSPGISQIREASTLCSALIEFARRLNNKPVLYITNDDYIELLYPQRDALRDYFVFSTEPDENVRDFLNKRSFYALCVKHGVELPQTYFPQDEADVRQISREIHYPSIIKPEYIHHFRKQLKGRKVIEVSNAEQLISNYQRLAEVDRGLIIQEVVPGPDSAIFVGACYLDSSSRPKAIFVGRKLRQYRPRFGSACLAESLWEPEVAELSLRFLESVGFRGLCGTEYKRDPRDGRFKMMEINPRLTLWMGLTRATGVDVPYIAYQDLTGAQVEPVRQVNGVKWIYATRDTQSAFHYFAKGELSLGDWFRSLRGCREEAILARDDLRIAFFIPVYAMGRFFRF